jgi:hypothetical protein
MSSSPLPDESSVLKAVLEPLLADLLYWFGEMEQLLAQGPLPFLTPEDQGNLQARLYTAQAEVRSAQVMVQLTDGKAGIDPQALVPWHQLMLEGWQVSARFRHNPASQAEPDGGE